MEEYEAFLRNQVLAIVKRGKACNAENMDDLMQEARLAFLIHLRKIESLDEILWCGKEILAAIWEYWRSMAIVYTSKNRFKGVISSVYRIDTVKEYTEDAPEQCASDGEVIFAAEYHDFLSTLTPREQIVVQMKLAGCTGREIIPVLHLSSEAQMSRLLQGVRKKTRAYFEQGETHEHR